MTKETGARMCLLKRQNDIMSKWDNDKIRDSMCLMKRQNDIMSKEDNDKIRDSMCLLKRQNDIMNKEYNDKIRAVMCLMKRQNDIMSKGNNDKIRGSSVKCVDAFRIALTEIPRLFNKTKIWSRLSIVYSIITLQHRHLFSF